MSAGLSVKVTDTITPEMKKLAAKLNDRRPVLEAMLVAIDRITVKAFTDAAYRVATWPPKKDGSESVLFLHGALKHSIGSNHVLTNAEGRTGTDRPYAAAQQFGYAPHNLPPRPFFPWVNQDELAGFAKEKVRKAAQDKLDKLAPQ